jgi:hypothetical protein
MLRRSSGTEITPMFGSIVQKGKFAASALLLDNALKSVDFPTFGNPTIPHFRPIPIVNQGANIMGIADKVFPWLTSGIWWAPLSKEKPCLVVIRTGHPFKNSLAVLAQSHFSSLSAVVGFASEAAVSSRSSLTWSNWVKSTPGISSFLTWFTVLFKASMNLLKSSL